MPEFKVQDIYDDEVEVYSYEDDPSAVYLAARDGGRRALAVLRPDVAEAVGHALIEQAGGNAQRAHAKPHPDAVLASSVSYNEALLRLAAAHDRTVEFSYSKGDGRVIERRRLQPESVREVKGHMTFTGFDPDRNDVRAYRLDRISGEVTL